MSIPNNFLLTLLQLSGCGVSTSNKIINFFESKKHELSSVGDLNDLIKICIENKVISNKLQYSNYDIIEALNKANEIIEKSQESEIHIISKYNPNYPKNLILKGLNHTTNTNPFIIYYKGNIDLFNQKTIAIIGTRSPTIEGIETSEFLGSYFGKSGYNVISGLAQGCDTFAHKGSLKVKGKTTAVLPVGLDSVYPRENLNLSKEIISNLGLLISEYPIGTKITKYNLVQRDRIVAGICDAGIVIQSSINGGTILTAKEILKQRKPLYVVKYKSSEVMNTENVLGNSYLETIGGFFLRLDDLEKIKLKL